MQKRSRPRKQTKKVEERNELLERLKEIAAGLGLEVREERLLREVGYSVSSGLCRVDEKEVVLLDKNTEPHERAEVLCGVLAERDLDAIYIEPEIRQRIGGRALPGDESVDKGLSA